VNERTVYRHFANEGELRDAVLEGLRDEAGVDLEGDDREGGRLRDTHVASAPTTWLMHPQSAAMSSGSMAGNIAMRSWLRPSFR
jgi:hypothetical protein